VIFYHHGTLLGSTGVANGSSLDVVWKRGACSNGYGSPPDAFVWSGGADGVPNTPVMGPCGHAPGNAMPKGPDDLVCKFSSSAPHLNCSWTFRASSGSAFASTFVGNPNRPNGGFLYLYKRTALFAYLITPGKAKQKISVPARGDTIQFAPAP
jgi:hypothetical protein